MVKVLVIDDYETAGVIIEVAAELQDDEVHHAQTPDEAEHLLKQSPVDLFIIAYHLLSTTGIKLADTLRLNYPAIPQILITVYKTDEVAKACRQRRILLLEKPWDNTIFKQAVMFYLQYSGQSEHQWKQVYDEAINRIGTTDENKKWTPQTHKEIFEQMRQDFFMEMVIYLNKWINRPEAEEIVHKAFDKIYRLNKPFLNAWNFRSYLKTTVRRRFITWIKKRKKLEYREKLPETEDPSPSPREMMIEQEQEELLEKILESLPSLDRQLIQLRYEGKSYLEIAEMTGFTEKQVKNKLYYIRQKIKEQFLDFKENF